MRRHVVSRLMWIIAVVLSPVALIADADKTSPRPNILLIVADDLGYADVGFNGCKDIPTPNLDRLAKQAVRCTNGYVTHPFCSPTRAGLLTGRYQQRFGHENNPAWLPESTVAGLPTRETTLPQVLKTAGYITDCIGKWHLGAHPQFHPNRRGFDEYFGLLGGGHVYLAGAKGGEEYTIPMNRNGRDEPLDGYLTDVLGREAAAFVEQHQSKPWFCYLAFNAPHTPLQVTDKQLDRVKHIADDTRRNYAGLVVGLDDAVGTLLTALHKSKQEDNTLIWFFSDNGGPVGVTHSDNTPLRGAKGQLFEGGIRTPFLISWPRRFPQGQDYAQPVTSLDVFATAIAVADVKPPQGHHIEGADLTPFLTGAQTDSPHERLFWRTGGGSKYAVREGEWKLVRESEGETQLFNLAGDISESRDVATTNAEVVTRLQKAYADWNRDNIAPLFESPRAKRLQTENQGRKQ